MSLDVVQCRRAGSPFQRIVCGMSQSITLVPRACDPIALHAWDVQSANGGSGGVTDSEDSAINHVTHALRTGEPGARGLIRKVALAPGGAPH